MNAAPHAAALFTEETRDGEITDTLRRGGQLHGTLTPVQIAVLYALASRADATGSACPGLALLAAEAGVSPSTLKRSLAELQQRGIVTRTVRQREGGGLDSTLYQLCLAPAPRPTAGQGRPTVSLGPQRAKVGPAGLGGVGPPWARKDLSLQRIEEKEARGRARDGAKVPFGERDTEIKSPATKLYREVEPDPVQERWERVRSGLVSLAKSQLSGAPPRPLAVWAFYAARGWDPADPRAGSVAELLRGIDPERVPPPAADGPDHVAAFLASVQKATERQAKRTRQA